MTRIATLVLGVGVALLGSSTTPLCPAGEENGLSVVFDMDAAVHRPGTFGADGRSVGTVDIVPGRFSDACRFGFVGNARSGFFTASVRADPQWDKAAGISFWMQGDGSASWGGLELIDASNYGLRYAYCFPIDSTRWRKITVPWCDLVPELPAGQPVDPEKGYAPSKFGNLWFGKWYYWGDYPAHSFTVDQIALERHVSAAFHRAGTEQAARLSLYCRDKVHLGPQGHRLAAETILQATTGKSREAGRLDAEAPPTKSAAAAPAADEAGRHPLPREHPRLLDSREHLQRLARQRKGAYQRVVRVARQAEVILRSLQSEFGTRAAPAWELAGAGGG